MLEDSYGQTVRHYTLILRDRNGLELTTVNSDKDISWVELRIVRDHEAEALRVDEKIDDVLELLNKL